jgi:hypothetical protein
MRVKLRRNAAHRLLKMCRQPLTVMLSIHVKEGEGEAADLGMVL